MHKVEKVDCVFNRAPDGSTPLDLEAPPGTGANVSHDISVVECRNNEPFAPHCPWTCSAIDLAMSTECNLIVCRRLGDRFIKTRSNGVQCKILSPVNKWYADSSSLPFVVAFVGICDQNRCQFCRLVGKKEPRIVMAQLWRP